MPRQSDPIPQPWRNSIVGHDVKPASWFLSSSKNIKIHPKAQQDEIEGSLNFVGWVQSVTVNQRTSALWGPQDRGVETLLNGHARIMLALRHGDETPIPVEFVDLDEAGEDFVLTLIDEFSRGAMKDKQKLDALLRDVTPESAALQQMLSELAAREGLYTGDGTPVDDPLAEWQGMPEFIHEDKEAFRTLIVHFTSEQDVQDFILKIGQPFSSTSKYIWHPKQQHLSHGLYVDES